MLCEMHDVENVSVRALGGGQWLTVSSVPSAAGETFLDYHHRADDHADNQELHDDHGTHCTAISSTDQAGGRLRVCVEQGRGLEDGADVHCEIRVATTGTLCSLCLGSNRVILWCLG